MTRDEFMKEANREIDQMLVTQRNRMIGLVERAWAEGKKNAEVSGIEDVVKEAIEKLYSKPDNLTVPNWESERIINWVNLNDNIPYVCKSCSNHPSNGGSGICHCIMGTPPITC